MKISVEINSPINIVVDLFMDKNNFKEWKNDFIEHELISGIAGEVGAVTKLIGRREVMYEKIISKNLPFEIAELYEHTRNEKIMMVHKATNRFTALSKNKTLFEAEIEIENVNGLLLKLIMKLMAGAGKKYSQKQLSKFKEFAERKTNAQQ